MSRDKHIEEIVKDICSFHKEYGSCKKCNEELDIEEDESCYWECVARVIVDNHYRKASEVALKVISEIIQEINELAQDCTTVKQTIPYLKVLTKIQEKYEKYKGENK